jgi:hypothetical protein
MVSSLGTKDPGKLPQKGDGAEDNIVLQTIREFLGSHKTFGENLIFILNRCGSFHSALRVLTNIDGWNRRLSRGSLRFVADFEDSLPPLHHALYARILLHERSMRLGGCLPSGAQRFTGRERGRTSPFARK